MKTWILPLLLLIGCSSREPAVERRCAHTGGMLEKICTYEVAEVQALQQDEGVLVYGDMEEHDGRFYIVDGPHRVRMDSIEEATPDGVRQFLVGRRIRAEGMYRSETQGLELLRARRLVSLEQATER